MKLIADLSDIFFLLAEADYKKNNAFKNKIKIWRIFDVFSEHINTVSSMY